MKKIVGKAFASVTLHRKDKVLSLAGVTKAIQIGNEMVPINSNQLINRIMCMIKNENDCLSSLHMNGLFIHPRCLTSMDS